MKMATPTEIKFIGSTLPSEDSSFMVIGEKVLVPLNLLERSI